MLDPVNITHVDYPHSQVALPDPLKQFKTHIQTTNMTQSSQEQSDLEKKRQNRPCVVPVRDIGLVARSVLAASYTIPTPVNHINFFNFLESGLSTYGILSAFDRYINDRKNNPSASDQCKSLASDLLKGGLLLGSLFEVSRMVTNGTLPREHVSWKKQFGASILGCGLGYGVLAAVPNIVSSEVDHFLCLPKSIKNTSRLNDNKKIFDKRNALRLKDKVIYDKINQLTDQKLINKSELDRVDKKIVDKLRQQNVR